MPATRTMQTTLDFDKPFPVPADPNVVADDRERLTGNSLAILERLKRGPASNRELSEVGGLRFGGRIFDLRAAGWRIETEKRGGGLVVYSLLQGGTDA